MRRYSSRRQAVGTLFGLFALGVRGRSLDTKPGVQLDLNSTGPSSIQFNGVEYLAHGDFRLDQVTFRTPAGKLIAGDLTAKTLVDFALKRVTRISSWGSIVADYNSAGNRLNVRVTVNNRSADILESIWFEPFGMRFPTRIQE